MSSCALRQWCAVCGCFSVPRISSFSLVPSNCLFFLARCHCCRLFWFRTPREPSSQATSFGTCGKLWTTKLLPRQASGPYLAGGCWRAHFIDTAVVREARHDSSCCCSLRSLSKLSLLLLFSAALGTGSTSTVRDPRLRPLLLVPSHDATVPVRSTPPANWRGV